MNFQIPILCISDTQPSLARFFRTFFGETKSEFANFALQKEDFGIPPNLGNFSFKDRNLMKAQLEISEVEDRFSILQLKMLLKSTLSTRYYFSGCLTYFG